MDNKQILWSFYVYKTDKLDEVEDTNYKSSWRRNLNGLKPMKGIESVLTNLPTRIQAFKVKYDKDVKDSSSEKYKTFLSYWDEKKMKVERYFVHELKVQIFLVRCFSSPQMDL